MATYNESLGGYVADVPRVVFRRCDKKAIYLDELRLHLSTRWLPE